jgi:hypothetical protein
VSKETYTRSVWGLTWVCALLPHDLAKRHRGRCNEATTLPAFGFTPGLMPNIELDLSLVVYVMTVEVSIAENSHGKREYNTQKRYFSLVRVLTVYSEHDFVLMLAVNLHGDDRSPRLFRTQHSQVLGPEHWK